MCRFALNIIQEHLSEGLHPDPLEGAYRATPDSLAVTVARYGHAVDLFFTPRAHVNHVYVRT